jgi:hypothetical protein
MAEILTIDQIESRYKNRWVLLTNVTTNAAHEITGGQVVSDSSNRGEIDQKAMRLPAPKRFAVLYMGSLPANAAVLL